MTLSHPLWSISHVASVDSCLVFVSSRHVTFMMVSMPYRMWPVLSYACQLVD